MKEQDIQFAVLSWLEKKNHAFVLPNVYLYGTRESDMISVTRSRYAWEIEIKTSMSDFLRDLSVKHKKHGTLGKYMDNAGKKNNCPKKFYFAIYGFKIPEGKLPAHAGLIVVDELGPRVTKPAPSLTTAKITDKMMMDICTRYHFRYWNMKKKKRMNNG